jgi:hypothetical protein
MVPLQVSQACMVAEMLVEWGVPGGRITDVMLIKWGLPTYIALLGPTINMYM